MWPQRAVVHILSCILLIALPIPVHAESLDQSTLLSITCSGCHGTDGKSVGAIPSIGGKSADYIEKAMLGFRDGSRPSTVMQRHAKGYTDEEIKQIANYFAGKK